MHKLKGVYMYVKQGSIEKADDVQDPILKNPDGKVFKVTYIVAFVWDKLDGKTTLKAIDTEIQTLSKEKLDTDISISNEAVKELLKVGLVAEGPMVA